MKEASHHEPDGPSGNKDTCYVFLTNAVERSRIFSFRHDEKIKSGTTCQKMIFSNVRPRSTRFSICDIFSHIPRA